MISARRSLTAGLTLWAALAVAPAPTRAQATSPGAAAASLREGDAPTRAALLAERQRVRADLEHVNAEIDTLKRAGRGLRDDYRLRDRLADAEALARRLTALDTRLGAGLVPAGPPAGTEPRALPTDGPAELDAKADILNDQARRLAARGDALLVRAHDLRARQNLRRRVGQMERDPFSPLEGSKRRAMTSGALSDPASTVVTSQGAGASNGDKGVPPPASPAPPAAPGPGSTSSPPPAVTGSAAPGAALPSAPVTTPTTADTANHGSSAVSSPKSVPTPTGTPTNGVALSVQLRDLLDPMTLAELQRLETTGTATTGYEALERAGTALKARADRLGQQAAALRARAH